MGCSGEDEGGGGSLVANGRPVTSLALVPAALDPPELDRLVDFSERPRTNDWSLRAALVRYAQPQPKQVSDLLDLVRRTEGALGRERARLEQDGPQLWAALEGGGTTDSDSPVVGLLRVARAFDELGDDLAEWATDISRPRPDAEVEEVIDEVAQQLDVLGVPREERPPGPRNRG
jgi:hypothetical protein